MLAKYSNKGNIQELQNLIEEAAIFKKYSNNNIRVVLYISGDEIFPEILRYYEKITKRERLISLEQLDEIKLIENVKTENFIS